MLKIAIVTRKMITGGVEKALIAMLKKFDYTDISVDLFLQSGGGELFQDIPEEILVNILQSPGLTDVYRHPGMSIKKGITMFRMRREENSYLEQNILSSDMLFPINKEYDIAIAYHSPNTVPVFFVIDKMRAKKKVLWLHGDLETNGGCDEKALRYYRQYDQVFAVSRNVYNSFVQNCPDRKNNIQLFYNFVDLEGIMESAENGETFQDGFTGLKILTIGRLNEQKGIDIAINACRKLVDTGYNIRWYVCGDGDDRKMLEQMIIDNSLAEHFILLGNQRNPFGYLKYCDLYVQPSRYEGYCTTTNEARMLGKPVITTEVSGAREQFIDKKTGWITAISEDSLFERICWCINHPDEVKQVVNRMNEAIQKDINSKDHPLNELLHIGDSK